MPFDSLCPSRIVSLEQFQKNLLENNALTIPVYQRNYSWSTQQIDRIIDDFKNFDGALYYMGVILLYDTKIGTYEIIDGQQRITTLLMLYHALKCDMPIKLDEYKFTSIESKNNISKNITHIKNKLELDDTLKGKLIKILDKLCFTIITTDSQDLAFTFFDTQNNRGVGLDIVDLFKSYHLRSIKNNEDLQVLCAQNWDHIAGNKQTSLQKFHELFWRVRNWYKQKLRIESKDLLIEEFEKNTFDSAIKPWNFIYESEQFYIKPATMNMTDSQITSSIVAGDHFFQFIKKYHALYHFLFHTDHSYRRDDLLKFSVIYDNIYRNTSTISEYLRDFFEICVLFYVSKYGTFKLYNFTEAIDNFIECIRLEKSSVYNNTPLVYIRDRKNPIAFLESSMPPDLVIKKIEQFYIPFKKQISNEEYKGVKKKYCDAKKKAQDEIYLLKKTKQELPNE